MKVKGIETRNVTVEITPKECFMALAAHFGLQKAIQPDYGSYYKEIRYKNKLVKLQLMVDVSHHGSPTYEPSGAPITDSKILAVYEHLNAIYKIAEDVH